jgi:hypothetical protein
MSSVDAETTMEGVEIATDGSPAKVSNPNDIAPAPRKDLIFMDMALDDLRAAFPTMT